MVSSSSIAASISIEKNSEQKDTATIPLDIDTGSENSTNLLADMTEDMQHSSTVDEQEQVSLALSSIESSQEQQFSRGDANELDFNAVEPLQFPSKDSLVDNTHFARKALLSVPISFSYAGESLFHATCNFLGIDSKTEASGIQCRSECFEDRGKLRFLAKSMRNLTSESDLLNDNGKQPSQETTIDYCLSCHSSTDTSIFVLCTHSYLPICDRCRKREEENYFASMLSLSFPPNESVLAVPPENLNRDHQCGFNG